MSKAKPSAVILAPDPALTALKTRATKLLKTWSECTVATTTDFESAGEALKLAVIIRKDLKALPVYVELAKEKADIKAKEKLLKDVDKVIESCEDTIRAALSSYAARERAKQEALIVKAMDKGNDEKAALIAAKPFVPEVQGLSFTEHWHAEGNDLLALAKAVGEGKISTEALCFNLVWLNVQARAQHEAMAIPGVVAVKETSSSVRT